MLNERLTNLGLEGTALLVREVTDATRSRTNVVGEYSGEKLREIIDLVDELEMQLGILRRAGHRGSGVSYPTFRPDGRIAENPGDGAGGTAFLLHGKAIYPILQGRRGQFGQIELDEGTATNGGAEKAGPWRSPLPGRT